MRACFNNFHPCKTNWSYETKLKSEEINKIDQFSQLHQFYLINESREHTKTKVVNKRSFLSQNGKLI